MEPQKQSLLRPFDPMDLSWVQTSLEEKKKPAIFLSILVIEHSEDGTTSPIDLPTTATFAILFSRSCYGFAECANQRHSS
jgi:hypothetical protein